MSKTATDARYASFLRKNPEYEKTSSLDELRRADFGRLDSHGHVYLDYTGGGLYGESQVRTHMEFLLAQVLGNPHSASPSSTEATHRVEECRSRILEFFGGSPDEYTVVFTANATHALKLVGEAYPFEVGSQFALTFDNHNSVNGIREFNRTRGGTTHYLPVVPPDMRTPDTTLEQYLEQGKDAPSKLFAFPAQSNFSGVQYDLNWIAHAQRRGGDVLLDAAAFVPTNRLDLGRWHPDYVVLSFYKMFGYPTGVGALIARKAALEKLRRPWFAGGTINVASVQADRYVMAAGAEAFEDGTLNYACIPAVVTGLDVIDAVGIDTIHTRVHALTSWLIEQASSIYHGNGRPVMRLYGPANMEGRGGTLALNFYRADGSAIDHKAVEALATEHNLSLRAGCFCNPGAGEVALDLSRDELLACLKGPDSRMTMEEFQQCIHAESTGAVRVSLGLVSNFRDVEAFLELVRSIRES